MKKQDFEQGKFTPDKVFFFGNHKLKNYRDNIQQLKSGMYTCIYLGNFADEMFCAGHLPEYCQEQGLR